MGNTKHQAKNPPIPCNPSSSTKRTKTVKSGSVGVYKPALIYVYAEKNGKEELENKGVQRETGNTQKTASSPTRLVAVNDKGLPVGEDHPRAVLANAEVDLVFELREEGYSMDWLAKKFEVSKSCIQKILNGTRRAVLAVGHRRIRSRGSAR